MSDALVLGGRAFESRLIVGTGKYSSPELMADALAASATELVTVALRRIDLDAPSNPITDFIDGSKYLLLPNTSGATTAREAVRLAQLAASAGLPTWIKVEVIPDPRYLMPDPLETLKACEILVKAGFTVLPYIQADPVLAKRLEDVGTAAVMPLASPIGSGRGLKMKAALEIIIEQSTVPVIVDAGLGVPSHAAAAMELGADAVLVNTAIAAAAHPARMAEAFRLGVLAGRAAWLAGRAPELTYAAASSPLTGFLSGAR
ncbi:MAG: thiazole synthase [Candidatus Eremiobacteraeota bacterium]|nr:thiazole synthase [Candidatus Eremiobacteraeota bacterium]MBC5827635.1 thiazole synthase [Candidatus Eremiobacteraeota bacterium]